MDDTLFVRNNRPNRVILKLNGLRHILERRGTREDSVALPLDQANRDPVIQRWLKEGRLEEISRDQFMNLASAEVKATGASGREGFNVHSPTDYTVPMESETQSRTPYVVHYEDEFDVPAEQRATKDQRVPSLEYVNDPEPTPAVETDVVEGKNSID